MVWRMRWFPTSRRRSDEYGDGHTLSDLVCDVDRPLLGGHLLHVEDAAIMLPMTGHFAGHAMGAAGASGYDVLIVAGFALVPAILFVVIIILLERRWRKKP